MDAGASRVAEEEVVAAADRPEGVGRIPVEAVCS